MEIEAVKTWQWMLIGLLAGGLFSLILAWSGPTFDTQARDTIEQGEFENAAFALSKFGAGENAIVREYHKDAKGQILPMLRDVTVHPPLPSDAGKRYWVTGRSYFVGRQPVDPTKVGGSEKMYEEWKPFKYPAAVPYVPGYTLREDKKLDKNDTAGQKARNLELAQLKAALGGQSQFKTVNEYLTAVSALPNASFKFQFAWWELPKFMWTMPPLAGLLMIGIAWPLTLSILQNFGMTKKPVVKKPVPKQIIPTKPVRIPSTAGVVLSQPAAKAAPPVDSKQYGGEFYPVVKTTHKE